MNKKNNNNLLILLVFYIMMIRQATIWTVRKSIEKIDNVSRNEWKTIK